MSCTNDHRFLRIDHTKVDRLVMIAASPSRAVPSIESVMANLLRQYMFYLCSCRKAISDAGACVSAFQTDLLRMASERRTLAS